MSRHRMVKALDLESELDDFDGGDDYGYDDSAQYEMSEDEKAQMRECTARVRQGLLPDISDVADKEIEESLWHYYYDVEKSVAWLRSKHSGATPSKTKKKSKSSADSVNGLSTGARTVKVSSWFSPCGSTAGPQSCASYSAEDFFRDSPWLKVPSHRRGELLLEPLCPRGVLLGGSSSSPGGKKVSKLAALAAKRREKDEERKSTTGKENIGPKVHNNSSLALLGKLNRSKGLLGSDTPKEESDHQGPKPKVPDDGTSQDVGPILLRQSSLPGAENYHGTRQIPQQDWGSPGGKEIRATPSTFARTMFGTEHLHIGFPSTIKTIDFSIAITNNTVDPNPFAGPSPDDVVIAAQTSKGQKTGISGGSVINGVKVPNHPASTVHAMSAEESSRARSKNLNVLAEYEKRRGKSNANFVVIGHVDHGKSTLMGRLLYDLKVIDSRTMEKYRKEAENVGKSSFSLAWALDQTSEERNRGVTMDIATKKFETEKTKFTILDAPGHRDFIPNMIAGASQADFAVLVIDGSPNAFESGLRGQTKEHALLVRSMGVQRMIVAVNKLDLVEWSKDRFDEIQQQTAAFLTIAGFQSKNISFIPCSGLTGDNIARRAVGDTASWYTGPILVELLEVSEPFTRALQKPLRITIADIFRGGVQNPLSVSGRLEAGSLQVGDGVLAAPSGEKAYIKGIEVDDGSCDWAVAGQIATLHLTDIDPVHLKTGDILCTLASPISNITEFTSKILAFDHVTPMNVDVHRGRLHAPGRITQLVATLDRASGTVLKKKPRILQPGNVARIKVEMDQPVPLEAATRIVLRANGETVAAGLVE